MIPSDAHALRAGLRPALIGAYFRLTEMLAAHAEDPSEPVRAFVHGEVQRLRETGRGVVEAVRQVEADARLSGFEAPVPPRVPADYGDWWDEVYDGFSHASGARAPLHGAGHALGMALVALNVLTVVLRVRYEDPDSPVLRQRTHVLLQELAFVRARCGHASTAEVPDDVRDVLGLVQERVSAVASMVEASHEAARASDVARLGQATQGVLQELDARVTALSAALHGRSVGEA